MRRFHFGPDNSDETYVLHLYPERTIDLGECHQVAPAEASVIAIFAG